MNSAAYCAPDAGCAHERPAVSTIFASLQASFIKEITGPEDGARTRRVIVPDVSTRISTHRRGIFRGAETLDKEALMIGLRVQARGRGNDSGQLAAKWVRFHD